MVGVMLTLRVKQSRASDNFPSLSSCRPLLRLASLRLKDTNKRINQFLFSYEEIVC